MYVKRPFGEKLNASFDFIKENYFEFVSRKKVITKLDVVHQ